MLSYLSYTLIYFKIPAKISLNYYVLLVSLSSKFKRLPKIKGTFPQTGKKNKTFIRKENIYLKVYYSIGVWYALLTAMMTKIRHMSLLLIKM